ncbi:phage tail protein, partial [Pseudomonas aeruginosa]|uniref:phage tail protein n=1 Tax=Pseudomonas aeruginosa TaxID=287 RepID=UPI0021ABA180
WPMADQQLPPPLAGDERFSLLLELLQETFAGTDLSVMAVYLVDQVRASLLPVLADQFSLLDEAVWGLAESNGTKRSLIKGSIELHRYKGTQWSIREVFRLLGFGEVVIHEGAAAVDIEPPPGTEVWPYYRVLMSRPITNEQAAHIRSLLNSIAPARCLLAALDY